MNTARGATLRVAGTVSLVAAVTQVAAGARGIRGFDWRTASEHLPNVAIASLDSELRFYAVWYGVAGFLMHRAAGDPLIDRAVRPLIAVGWGAAALSRVFSIRRNGLPDRFFVGLAAVEGALATVLATTD